MRGRTNTARSDSAQLLRGRSDPAAHPARRRDRRGPRRHRAVPGRAERSRGARRGGPGRADRPPDRPRSRRSGPVSADFTASREQFDQLLGFLTGTDAAAMAHAHLEEQLSSRGRALLKGLLQDHLDLRASREQPQPAPVAGADTVTRTRIETGHQRGLATVFGPVTVTRIGYRAPGADNLYPADAALNLPQEKHSHGMRQLAAIEAPRGSYDDAADAITRATGQQVGKRQVEQLAQRAAIDFDDFYTHRQPPADETGNTDESTTDDSTTDDLLVLSCDGKGVVMRPDALRPATSAAAAKSRPKLRTRLSPGEKRNRKRIAEVGAVYDATAAPRTS